MLGKGETHEVFSVCEYNSGSENVGKHIEMHLKVTSNLKISNGGGGGVSGVLL